MTCAAQAAADAGTCGGKGSSSFPQSVDVSNRAEVTRLLKRLAVLDATPSASPAERAWLRSIEPALHAAEQRFAVEDRARATRAADAEAHAATDKARMESIVHPNRKPSSIEECGDEIIRLRRLTPAADDAALKNAIAARIGELTSDWTDKARAFGWSPPTASFQPYSATTKELERAFLWTSIVGAVPLEALQQDGGVQFRKDIVEAMILRTPKLGEELIASYANDPPAQRVLLEREMRRLGSTTCRADETNDQLIARRADLLHQQHAVESAPDEKARYIGLDGLTGTLRTTVDYEIEQRVVAMNPGSTTGAMAAAASARSGGSIEDIRAAGEGGNAVEGIAGSIAGVDPRTIGKPPQAPHPQPEPQTSGQVYAPPAPERRVAPMRPFSNAEGTSKNGATASTANGERCLRVSMNQEHILDGEVKPSKKGPRAVGFHHESPRMEATRQIVPGTETKPDRFGVYRAEVRMKDPQTGQWIAKHALTTFFPKAWTDEQINVAIDEAFANRTYLRNGKWCGKLSNGMAIQGYVDRTNARKGVTSAYPLWQGEE